MEKSGPEKLQITMSASSEVHDPEPFVMSAPSVAFLLHFQQTNTRHTILLVVYLNTCIRLQKALAEL